MIQVSVQAAKTIMDQKTAQNIASDNHLDDLSTSCKQNDRPFERRTPRRSYSGSSSLRSSRTSSLSSRPSSSSRSRDSPSSSYTIPPDGGWGWVVVFASFWCNVIVDGIIFSFGILMLEVSKQFNTSKGTTAWIGSLQAGCYLMIGMSCHVTRRRVCVPLV